MIGWLIKQQQLWSECKGESKCGTLFFTAGSELWIRIRIELEMRKVFVEFCEDTPFLPFVSCFI